jgi:hypothetical protein
MQGEDVLVLMRTNGGRMKFSTANLSVRSDYSFDTRGEWVFFAVSVAGGREVEISFYRGTKTEPVKRVSVTRSSREAERWRGLGGQGNIALGNVSGKGGSQKRFNRPFPGRLDNIRLFGSGQGAAGALSREDLEKIRKADARNEIPGL